MKLKVTLKDPDALLESIADRAWELKKSLTQEKGLSDAGATAEAEAQMDDVRKLARRFFEYGEYLSIELDTESGTATVVPLQ